MALIEQSGLTPEAWLRRYLNAYLTPLLHSFYAYDLAFMPHGENVILVLDGGSVEKVIFKDIAEEIAIMNPEASLPPEVERIRVEVPDDLKLLAIFTDVFDCFFRYLSSLWTPRQSLTRAPSGERSLNASGPTATPSRTWLTASRSTTVRGGVRTVLPQPAPAAQQPADARPD